MKHDKSKKFNIKGVRALCLHLLTEGFFTYKERNGNYSTNFKSATLKDR